MKKIVIMTMLLAFSLTALLVGVAAAGPPTNIRISDSPDGEAVIHFPSGTEVVYYIFDYTDMEGEEIKVRVYDNVGNILFEQTKAYQGAGTESIAIHPEKGAFPDSRYVTNLYLGGYGDVAPGEGFVLAKTIIWEVGEPISQPSPETIEETAAPPKAERGNLPFIVALVVIMLLFIVLVFWAFRRALAAS